MAAQEGGADRVELCAALPLGGITPSYAAIKQCVGGVSIPVHVLIRPRPGDFVYGDRDVELMCEDIAMARDLGACGIVCGALNVDGTIDMWVMERLLRAAGGCSFTFHRAFDLCSDPFEALYGLIDLGVDTLLTSGLAAAAPAGAGLLGRLEASVRAKPGPGGKLLTVMAGCGLNAGNVAGVVCATGVRAVHLSARRFVASPMRFCREGISMGIAGVCPEYDYEQTSLQEVAACRRALDVLGRA